LGSMNMKAQLSHRRVQIQFEGLELQIISPALRRAHRMLMSRRRLGTSGGAGTSTTLRTGREISSENRPSRHATMSYKIPEPSITEPRVAEPRESWWWSAVTIRRFL
jgi:hypothetical protein